MKVSDFDYHLPEELIAQEPLCQRDASRLLVLHRSTGDIEHKHFADLPGYLKEGDVCVLNNSRVINARLTGKKQSGGRVEVLLLGPTEEPDVWEALVKPGRKVLPGTELDFGQGLGGVILDRTEQGGRTVRLSSALPLDVAIERAGDVPLPPYIKKRLADPERYQTVYADVPGSVAAPTAGLHFTPRVFDDLRQRGVCITYLTLHVGLGTFRPVSADTVENHHMHEEHYCLSRDCADAVNRARASAGRVIAVGTTVTRTLESVASKCLPLVPQSGETSLFIYPGYQWKVVDCMLTNFHLPKSTLLMLVSSFAGRDNVLRAYAEAVSKRYRFFSFGDAMLIVD